VYAHIPNLNKNNPGKKKKKRKIAMNTPLLCKRRKTREWITNAYKFNQKMQKHNKASNHHWGGGKKGKEF